MYEFTGKILKVSATIPCTGKVKEKCTFVVRDDKDGREIQFLLFDQQIYELLQPLELQDLVKVTFTIKSREFGSKWETNCFAINIVKVVKKQEENKYKKPFDDFFSGGNDGNYGYGYGSSKSWGGSKTYNNEQNREKAQKDKEEKAQREKDRKAEEFWESMRDRFAGDTNTKQKQQSQNQTYTDHFAGCYDNTSAKKRYRELSKKYHPDMPTGDTVKMQEVNKQYQRYK